MEVKELLRWARQEPFAPFVVILQSGTRISVNHPEEIVFLPNPERVWQVAVFWADDGFYFGPTAVTAIQASRTGSAASDAP